MSSGGVTIRVEGAVDRVAPTLLGVGTCSGNPPLHPWVPECGPKGLQRNPLDVTALKPSEALTVGAEAYLVDESGLRIDPSLVETFGVLERFEVETILPLGTTWQWVVLGTDLGGNAFAARSDLSLPAPPAFVPADLEGNVEFVESAAAACGSPDSGSRTSLGSLAPISGNTSFLVAAGSTVVFKTARPPGTTSLRVSLRRLYGEYGSTYPLTVRAGVVGGVQRTSVKSRHWDGDPAGASPVPDTVDLNPYSKAMPVEDVVLSLPEAGGEALVEITGVCDRTRSAPYETAAWVDSITFE